MYAWEELAYARLEGYEEGFAESYAKSYAEKGREIALKLLQRKMPVDEVAEITGLSIEEVNRLSQ